MTRDAVDRRSVLQRVLRLRWPRWAAILSCAVVGVCLPAGYGALNGIPEPRIHDEFSYLLGADTFAHGRLTNPPPALPAFFEAPHVLVVPTYNSKYPPAQALALAIGQVLTGRAIWGVWITCGLFAASLCWMLQAWTSRRLALAASLLSAATLGTSTYWAQSYWGGMMAATGGALLFGATIRLARAPAAALSAILAISLLILANSRPYEGLLAAIGSAVILAIHKRAGVIHLVPRAILPITVVLIAGAALMGTYNRAVTGSVLAAPYQVHSQQYLGSGLFVFSETHEPELRSAGRVARFYNEIRRPDSVGDQLRFVARNLVVRTVATIGGAFGMVEGYRNPPYVGAFLWLALLLGIWRFRSAAAFVPLGVVAVSAELLLWRYSHAYLTAVSALVIAAWILAYDSTRRRNRRSPSITAALLIAVAGQSLVLWWWPHYAAPVIPLIIAAAAMSLERLARRRAAALSRLGVGVLTLIVLHLAAMMALYVCYGRLDGEAFDGDPDPRADIVRQLERLPGSDLVFVRYDPSFSIDAEWVYNGADLDGAAIIFAHDLGADRDAALISRYPDRVVWLVTVSAEHVELVRQRSGADGPRSP